MLPWVGYKLWRLREGGTVGALHRLTSEEIAPHYARLSPEVRLRLDLVQPGHDAAALDPQVLAIQEWSSRTARDAAFQGPSFAAWWQDYLPVLRRWDDLAELVSEWDCERLE